MYIIDNHDIADIMLKVATSNNKRDVSNLHSFKYQ